jgi:flavin reductase (DIM6/NTAB) family NADH-FMN oxidoreductase RutF
MSIESVAANVNLREFAGCFPTGVAVVTTNDDAGGPCGSTISALTSLSLDPPLLLICLSKTSKTLEALRESRRFCINLLSSEQAPISKHFASKSADKFSTISYSIGELEVPLIEGALAHGECTVHALHDGGDHTIVVGKVESTMTNSGDPLLYYQARYPTFSNPG